MRAAQPEGVTSLAAAGACSRGSVCGRHAVTGRARGGSIIAAVPRPPAE